MNPDLNRLQPYPFEKLAALKNAVTTQQPKAINLSMGEPKHKPPAFIEEAMINHISGLRQYPITRGMPELRQAISQWLTKRFKLPADSIDAEQQVLPVNGTREALFAFAQAVIERKDNALVVMPNPFYQIYEGAAILAGASPWFMNTTQESDWLPDFDSVPEAVWQQCQLIYLCSPGNPSGAVIDSTSLQKLINLSERYDFIIASDECYSELYYDEDQPPTGLLEVCAAMGNTDYQRCVVFHSLSKRSNVPGLRSGFVAGDAKIIKQFLLYRTYHGCAMPIQTQMASISAWADETHVQLNREHYRAKYDAVMDILTPVMNIQRPPASFYLWPETPIADTDFTQSLFAEHNVTVLPGSYLSRQAHGINPGENRIRIALVAEIDECIEAAERIHQHISSL